MKKLLTAFFVLCLALNFQTARAEELPAEELPAEELQAEEFPAVPIVGASIYVEGRDFGPTVTKVIVELEEEASSVAVSGLTMNIAGQNHEPGKVYLCDEAGNRTEKSKLVAFDIGDPIYEGEPPRSFMPPSAPSVFTRTDMSISVYVDSYVATITADSFTLDDKEYSLQIEEDCINNRICPAAERFNYRGSFEGTYENPITGEMEDQVVTMAAYEPESLAGGAKNPLIIWLHGQGEGGHEPEVAILGNRASALAMDPIQGYFVAGDQKGAYVLIPQIETYWMDEGDNTNGQGAGVSRYTEALMDAINAYLAHNEDVDTNRIYLGGASNGGYMVMNMLVSYPDVFAAAFPACEAYSYYAYVKEDGLYVQAAEDEEDAIVGNGSCLLDPEALWFDDEKVQLLKDMPIWFMFGVDDGVVPPHWYEYPTYISLLQAGAENVYVSLYKGVMHFVWIPLFNNEFLHVQDNELWKTIEIPSVSDADKSVYEPYWVVTKDGGELLAEDFEGLFDWLNAQSKAEKLPAVPTEKASIYVDGQDFGPVVTKVIVELAEEASSVEVSGLNMKIAGQRHEPGDVYLCDAEGNPAEKSNLVCFEIGAPIYRGEAPRSFMPPSAPSVFTRTDMSISVYVDEYIVILAADSFTVDGQEYSLQVREDCINNRICPAAEAFNYRSSFAGTYLNQITGEEEDQVVSMAAYEPESLAGGEKNPLIIWLHGQGEGGHEPEVAILGNRASALAMDPIQGYFHAGDQTGAYVLIPQIETYFMDEGDNTNGQGAGVSRYTEALMDAINDYLAHNDDVDTNRIYLGGASNGGYMVMNMLVCYPDVFAAAFPACEAYSYYAYIKEDGLYVQAGDADDPIVGNGGCLLDPEALWFDEEKVELLKDMPIWFMFGVDDGVVPPAWYEYPTYVSLLQAGAENVYVSLYKGVMHFVWIPLFNNEFKHVQDNEVWKTIEIPSARDADKSIYQPYWVVTGDGGECTAGEFEGLFDWMNAQSR